MLDTLQAQIHDLYTAALAEGDTLLAQCCEEARRGNVSALRECERVLSGADPLDELPELLGPADRWDEIEALTSSRFEGERLHGLHLLARTLA